MVAIGAAILLNFICADLESARIVAIERRWESVMPARCRVLDQGLPEQAGILQEVVDVIPIEAGDGSTAILVGRVLRNGHEVGFSAGVATLNIV